jgi:aspartate/methionine/tyrosine aminotransferase
VFSRRSFFSAEPNALARALSCRAGRAYLDLTISNPTRAALPYEREGILGALASADLLDYDPRPFGIEAARAAVSRELASDGVAVPTERVVLTASTSEAYGFAFKLLCDPGDAVLVPAPSYPLFEHLAALESVRLVPYRLAYDGAWHVDLDSLRRARVPEARAIMVVSPNNPTGSYAKRVELEAMAELGLPIVSDEVFARYPLRASAEHAPSALSVEGVLVVALGGLSKLAALPQLKLAWMALGGPEREVASALERLELIADTYLSVSAPVQRALPELFTRCRTTRDAIRTRTTNNLARLEECFVASAATVLFAEGGWYAVLRLPRVKSEEQWVLELLGEADVLVQPGWFFDFEDEPHAVLSLLTPEAVFLDGIARIRALVG